MKKRFVSLLLVLVLCIGLAFTVSAGENAKVAEVIDNANLLTAQEESVLTAKLAEVAAKYDISLVVVTEVTLNGKYIRDFADDYYDYNGYRDDGAVLVLSMDDRAWWVSTKGDCIDKIKADEVEDGIISYLRVNQYYNAFCEFAEVCDEEMRPPYLFTFIICLGIGLAIAFSVTGAMRSQLKTVRAKGSASDYICEGSLQVEQSRDLYLYTSHIKTVKPKSNSSGSSGSHVSSSGSSHGGGGGHF